MSLQVARSKSC